MTRAPEESPAVLEEELSAALPQLRAHLARRAPRGASEDLAQEAALRALHYRAAYDPRRGLWPWLRRLADRVLVDHLRREGRAPRSEEELDPESRELRSESEEQESVARLVAGLPADEREALLAFHVDGLSVAELASRLGVPPGTVKSRLSRARRRLAEWEPGEGRGPAAGDPPRKGAER